MANSKIPIGNSTDVQATNIPKLSWYRSGKVVTIAAYGIGAYTGAITLNPPPKAKTGMEVELFYGAARVGYLEYRPSQQQWVVDTGNYGYGTLTYICE